MQTLEEDESWDDDAVPPVEDKKPTNKKPARDNRLSVTSQAYDRDGKGFLDETEKAMRQMDQNNQGYLDVHQIYEIMSGLEEQQGKAATLKNTVYMLSAFALLLALANVGTSIAAARMAKDTNLGGGESMIDTKSGKIISTSEKMSFTSLNSLSEGDGRRLGGGSGGSYLLSRDDYISLCQEFCSKYKDESNWNGQCGTGTDKTNLEVGRHGIPTELVLDEIPKMDDDGNNWVVFQATRGNTLIGPVTFYLAAGTDGVDPDSVDAFKYSKVCENKWRQSWYCMESDVCGCDFDTCHVAGTAAPDCGPEPECCFEGDCCPSSAPTLAPTLFPTPSPTEPTGPPECSFGATLHQVCKLDIPHNKRWCCPGQNLICVKRAPWLNRVKCHNCTEADHAAGNCPDYMPDYERNKPKPTEAPTDSFLVQGGTTTDPPTDSPTPSPTEDNSRKCPKTVAAYAYCGDMSTCYKQSPFTGVNKPDPTKEFGWSSRIKGYAIHCSIVIPKFQCKPDDGEVIGRLDVEVIGDPLVSRVDSLLQATGNLTEKFRFLKAQMHYGSWLYFKEAKGKTGSLMPDELLVQESFPDGTTTTPMVREVNFKDVAYYSDPDEMMPQDSTSFGFFIMRADICEY